MNEMKRPGRGPCPRESPLTDLDELQLQVLCHLEGFTHSENVANDVLR